MASAKALYERWLTRLWAGKRIAAEIVTTDFVGHWPDREIHGPDELQAIIDETRNMLADLTFTIELGPLIDGEMVAGRWVGRAAPTTSRWLSPVMTSCGSRMGASRSTGPAPRRV